MSWTGPCLGIGGTATENIWLVIKPILSFYLFFKNLKWLLDLKYLPEIVFKPTDQWLIEQRPK